MIKLIPTYNEKENIAALAGVFFDLHPRGSILVLDDNSPDGTAAVVREAQNRFPALYLHQRSGPRGFGLSYLEGFQKVLADDRFDYLVMMDADFSHDPKEIAPMLAKLGDFEAVNGSRYVVGGRIKNWRWSRRVLSRFANFYARTILGLPLRDLTTGFLCFRKEILRRIDLNSLSSDGYAFLIELKYKLWRAGVKFGEHPIVYDERREGQSKMSSKIVWESIWLPWKLRFQSAKVGGLIQKI